MNIEIDGKALRYNEGKPRPSLLPVDSLQEVLSVYEYGAKKYGDYNWARGQRWTILYDCLMRHAWAWFLGEERDKESGLRHSAHMAWNCLAIVAFEIRGMNEQDDRPICTRAKIKHTVPGNIFH